jgi:hypothetical protein
LEIVGEVMKEKGEEEQEGEKERKDPQWGRREEV